MSVLCAVLGAVRGCLGVVSYSAPFLIQNVRCTLLKKTLNHFCLFDSSKHA
jgi:NADH:ubiquinone oxidoreductase subunit H